MPVDVESLRADWSYPTNIRFGAGRVAELPGICRELGIAYPLLVTDSGLAELDLVKGLKAGLEAAGLPVQIFSDFQPNPVLADAVRGVAAYKAGKHDGVVALGGGSSIDVGKSVAFGSVQDRPLAEYLIGSFAEAPAVLAKTKGDLPPVISVPTTAGTGSEIGRTSALIDEEAKVKKGFFHPDMLPKVCLADPEMTAGLPPGPTAAFGMDALSHNLEAYCSVGYHPIAEGCALAGMRLIKGWLPQAVKNGGDIVARAQVMAASLAGGTAFQKGVGGAHALSHPLSSVFGIHHGLANGVIMPYIVAFNSQIRAEELTALARYLDLPDHSPQGVVDWLKELRQEIGIPHTLDQIGVSIDEIPRLAKLAAIDIAADENPIPLSESVTKKLYEQAFSGEIAPV